MREMRKYGDQIRRGNFGTVRHDGFGAVLHKGLPERDGRFGKIRRGRFEQIWHDKLGKFSTAGSDKFCMTGCRGSVINLERFRMTKSDKFYTTYLRRFGAAGSIYFGMTGCGRSAADSIISAHRIFEHKGMNCRLCISEAICHNKKTINPKRFRR